MQIREKGHMTFKDTEVDAHGRSLRISKDVQFTKWSLNLITFISKPITVYISLQYCLGFIIFH